MTVGLGIICHQRPAELREALASTSGDSFAERVVLDSASEPPIEPPDGVRFLRSDENLGCSRGRNALVDAASTDVLALMDDDAVMPGPAAERLRQLFAANPRLGLVAFRIVRPDGSFVRHEQPFRRAAAPVTEPRPCAYFVGAGFAVRRSAYVAVGGSDPRVHYLGDELPLAFRLIGAGWELAYEPSIVVEHRPSPRGRALSTDLPGKLFAHHAITARGYLPWPIAAAHIAAWAVTTARRAQRGGALGTWRDAAAWGLTTAVERRPITWRAAWRAHRLGGRVLY
jgi:GT2 family glycosyltransferase